jgi:hypothetical protein
MDEPIETILAQARLTGSGEGLAGHLKHEAEFPQQARELVLTLLWQSPKLPGIATRTIPKKSGGVATVGNPVFETGKPTIPQPGSGTIPTPKVASLSDNSTAETTIRPLQPSSPKESGMGEHAPNDQSHGNAKRKATQYIKASHARWLVGIVVTAAWVAPSIAEYWNHWWMKLIVYSFGFACSLLLFSVLYEWAEWKLFKAAATAFVVWVAYTSVVFLASYGGGMPGFFSNPILRFALPVVLTVAAAITWYRAFRTTSHPNPTTAPQIMTLPPPRPATTPSTAPSSTQPIVTKPSRPTGPTVPTTRSPIAILRGYPPPIETLIYAEFGEGDMDSVDRWLITCNDGETLISRVQALFRQADPSRITLSGLHLPDKFLDGDPKQLKLYFSDGTKIILNEGEYLSTEVFRQKIKRKVDRENTGLMLRSHVNFGDWPKGSTFTEFDFAKKSYQYQRTGVVDDSYLETLEDHLKKGNIEILL